MLLEFRNFFQAAYKASRRGTCGGKSCSRMNKGEWGFSDDSNTLSAEKINKLELSDKSVACYYDEKNQKVILELPIINNQINIALEQAKNFMQINEREVIPAVNTASGGKYTNLVYDKDKEKNIKNKLFVYYLLEPKMLVPTINMPDTQSR